MSNINYKRSHDGKQLAVADKAFTIHVFDAADFSLVTKLYGHRARISSMGWSENGWLASGMFFYK